MAAGIPPPRQRCIKYVGKGDARVGRRRSEEQAVAEQDVGSVRVTVGANGKRPFWQEASFTAKL